MTIAFRPAVRENVALIVGLAGGTGSGKTFTAMRLAAGMSGGKRFAVIDTEAGRAKHYADQFAFDHGDLAPPFTPAAYADAIATADKAGYPVIVIDSFSHEWAGDGGVLDMQEAELDRMAGDNWQKREACKMAAWIKPKGEHKRMMQRLLQVRAHLILCFRAEPKVEMRREPDEHGKMKTKIVAKESLVGKDGWIPITEKNLPFECTTYFLLLASAPGVAEPIKLQEQHRAIFPAKEKITEDAGRALAAWALGGDKSLNPQGLEGDKSSEMQGTVDLITPDQAATLETLCQDKGIPVAKLREKVGVPSLAAIKSADYQRALAWIDRAADARRGTTGGTEART